jgi:hypothetical protein
MYLCLHLPSSLLPPNSQPIYSISFFEPLMAESPDETVEPMAQYFASVGGNRASIYKVSQFKLEYMHIVN